MIRNIEEFRRANRIQDEMKEIDHLLKSFKRDQTIFSEVGLVGYSNNGAGRSLHFNKDKQLVFKRLMPDLGSKLNQLAIKQMEARLDELRLEFETLVGEGVK